MNTYWVNGRIAPLILDLGTRWRWVVSFTPRSLYPGEKRIRGWVCSRSGLDAMERRKILIIIPAGDWTTVVQPVA